MRNRSIFLLAALAPALLLAGSCGYTLEGRGSFLPAHIVRIGIPIFENSTGVPGLEEIITGEVHSEFVSRGNYVISANSRGVDAVLEGEVTVYNLVPRAVDEEGVATSYVVMITADLVFRDLVDNRVIWQQAGYNFSEEYQLSGSGDDFVSLEAESVRLAASDFAGALVSTILSGF